MGNNSEERLVAALSELMALKYGIYPAAAQKLRVAAGLHDIGKTGIPGSILNKPDKLTADEFEIMKTHTLLGTAILTNIQGDLGEMARTLSHYHHEKWDGSGYWGKLLCQLPPYVGIVSLCDVAVALLSKRVYKPAWTADLVLQYINNQAGKHFNPILTDLFIELMRHDDNMKILLAGYNIDLTKTNFINIYPIS